MAGLSFNIQWVSIGLYFIREINIWTSFCRQELMMRGQCSPWIILHWVTSYSLAPPLVTSRKYFFCHLEKITPSLPVTWGQIPDISAFGGRKQAGGCASDQMPNKLKIYWLSTDFFLFSMTSTDSLLTSIISLLTLYWLLLTLYWLSTDFYWLSTDFYWLSTKFYWLLLTFYWLSTDFLLTSTDSANQADWADWAKSWKWD